LINWRRGARKVLLNHLHYNRYRGLSSQCRGRVVKKGSCVRGCGTYLERAWRKWESELAGEALSAQWAIWGGRIPRPAARDSPQRRPRRSSLVAVLRGQYRERDALRRS
jgi:hypothetical protein